MSGPISGLGINQPELVALVGSTAASRSPLVPRFGAEARLEAARALTTLQRVGRGSGRQDAEPDELRMELVGVLAV